MERNPPPESPEQTARTWNVAYVACRVLAVYILVQAVVRVGGGAEFLFSELPERWPAWVGVAGLILAGFLLWSAAPRVADAFWVDAMPHEGGTRISRPDLERIAFGVVGLLLIAERIPVILGTIGDIIVRNRIRSVFREPAGGSYFTQLDYVHIAANLVALGIGAWLLLRGDVLSEMLHRYRTRHLERLRRMDEEDRAE